MRRAPVFGLVALVLLSSASRASADLVFFASGRSLSVREARTDGNDLVLVLRGGGEIVCPRALVTRIEASEVPDPEPDEDAVPELAGALPSAAEPSELRPPPKPLASLISRAAARHGVDARLVQAVVQVESGYQSRAKSRKGAKGLMQLMPRTARQYGVRNSYDPVRNLDAGVRHLRGLLDRLPLELALAAYNAGEASVARFRGIPPYPETQSYVDRILKLINAQTDTP